MTPYEKKLHRRMNAAMEKHPRSIIVMDAHSMEIIATGRDPDTVASRIRSSIKEGQVPLVFKRPKDNQLLIL